MLNEFGASIEREAAPVVTSETLVAADGSTTELPPVMLSVSALSVSMGWGTWMLYEFGARVVVTAAPEVTTVAGRTEGNTTEFPPLIASVSPARFREGVAATVKSGYVPEIAMLLPLDIVTGTSGEVFVMVPEEIEMPVPAVNEVVADFS
jgi:hypothetical protein